DAKLRENFQVEDDYGELARHEEFTWPALITGITDATHQVVNVSLNTSDRQLAKRAGKAVLSLTGAELPGLLGVQVIGPDGQLLANVNRAEIMMLNVPLGKGRPEAR